MRQPGKGNGNSFSACKFNARIVVQGDNRFEKCSVPADGGDARTASGNDCEVAKAVQGLREWTGDCVEWNYRNSFRNDLKPAAGDVPYEGGHTRAMSPRETSVRRGSRNAYSYDGGAGGRRVMEPTGFLRDYWMGRYHGFIQAPVTKDSELLTVKPRSGQKFGAEPYAGEPRPGLY